MAPVNPSTLFTAARTGSRVVRYLIRPARRLPARSPDSWGRDPWLPPGGPGHPLRRGVSVVRRAVGLLVLLALCVLGALLLGPLLLLLGVGTAFGSDVAGWLLAFTLLLATFGAVWTARRATLLIRAREEGEADLVTLDAPTGSGSAARADDEAGLLALLRGSERALPTSTRAALHATVIATRDALRVTAGDLSLGRDAFDARQAAREDLPELLRAYHAAPRTPQADDLLLGQLALIERRMSGVVRERQKAQARTLDAHRRYLEGKYGERREEG
ncbi:hypothetical protein DAETH_08930 [Deinococcus aetherius]|uniref:Uncharacterized protein n=1 Tax=Deinococcus aetherius TaxID=200252 RepID=A0ABN6RDG2_9DEIO|nr:hypothetical protein [Deinococcus aetherius]BDP40924.1 hypothetical protein DAETH_08930 [Deinococcus aetherius]